MTSYPLPRHDVSIHGDVENLPSSLTSAIFRITQEGVTNARRHGRNLTTIDVTVSRFDNRVEISVVNDGVRAVLDSGGGYGILGMTERCEILGGALTPIPQPQGGWEVHASLPIESNQS